MTEIYAPAQVTAEEEIIKFYTGLQITIEKIREENDKLIILGDWNARIGKYENRRLGCLAKYGEEVVN